MPRVVGLGNDELLITFQSIQAIISQNQSKNPPRDVNLSSTQRGFLSAFAFDLFYTFTCVYELE